MCLIVLQLPYTDLPYLSFLLHIHFFELLYFFFSLFTSLVVFYCVFLRCTSMIFFIFHIVYFLMVSIDLYFWLITSKPEERFVSDNPCLYFSIFSFSVMSFLSSRCNMFYFNAIWFNMNDIHAFIYFDFSITFSKTPATVIYLGTALVKQQLLVPSKYLSGFCTFQLLFYSSWHLRSWLRFCLCRSFCKFPTFFFCKQPNWWIYKFLLLLNSWFDIWINWYWVWLI